MERGYCVNRKRACPCPNPFTQLVFDSYYMSKGSRDSLERRGIKIPCLVSCKPDNFKVKRQFLSKDAADEPGDEQSIYNENSGELFNYHYDTQKGVGETYNLSSGLVRCTNPNKIQSYKKITPGYSHYKVLFEPCDKFNRNLHDRHWPYKRGGRNVKGGPGSQYDFIFACILQNTFNCHDAKNENYGNLPPIEHMCCELADDVYAYS